MPFSNSRATISDSIRSVLNQTYPFFRLVLVNNFSNDGSLSIVHAFAALDSRITVLDCTSGRGASYARNYALNRTDCSYIAFCDSDDVWLSHHLAYSMHTLSLSVHSTVSYSPIFIKSRGVSFLGFKPISFPCLYLAASRLLRCSPLNIFNNISLSSVVIKNTSCQSFSFDEFFSYAEDWSLWLHLLSSRFMFAPRSQPTVIYSHDSCKNRSNLFLIVNSRFKVRRKYLITNPLSLLVLSILYLYELFSLLIPSLRASRDSL